MVFIYHLFIYSKFSKNFPSKHEFFNFNIIILFYPGYRNLGFEDNYTSEVFSPDLKKVDTQLQVFF